MMFRVVFVFLLLASIAEAREFHHFFLKEFYPSTQSVQDVFEESPFHYIGLFPPTVFESNEAQIEFFTLNGSDVSFPEINLRSKYYFDTKAMSHKRIFVLLFGTLWDPDTLNLLRVMRQLHETYSREALNQESLVMEGLRWYKEKIHTGYTPKVYEGNTPMELEDWQKLESAEHGVSLFMPGNVFVLLNQLTDLLMNVPYKTDVIFAFVAVSGDDADAQEILKDEDIPFAFLDDPDGSRVNIYVQNMVPSLLIVDHENEIEYHGKVLKYLEIKSIIDHLMVGVFEDRADAVFQKFHKMRLDRHEKKLRKELKMKKQKGQK